MDATDLLERIRRAFPATVAPHPAAPHACEECDEISRALSGVTWEQVPTAFLHANSDVLPLLSDDAYLAYLPAWMVRAATDPGGEVAGILAIHLGYGRRGGFSPEQALVVLDTARHVLMESGYGFDEVAADQLREVESAWGSGAV